MIIVRLSGGMGNQMFQYALGRSLALKNNVPLGLDVTYLLDRTPIPNFTFREYNLEDFNIDARIVSGKEIPFLHRKYNIGWAMRYIDFIRRKLLPTPGKERRHSFNPAVLELGPDVYLEGWWQSPNYFSAYKNVIRQDFTLKHTSEKIQKLIMEIQSKNSVCVHIRRGDYVGNNFYPTIDESYYKKALAIIAGKYPIDCVYVFDRDDIEWCKKNLHFDQPVVFVENDTTMAEYVTIMAACTHFVMANSSLSWWAAWLGTNPNKIVIAPKKWFRNGTIDTTDLIPSEWVRL